MVFNDVTPKVISVPVKDIRPGHVFTDSGRKFVRLEVSEHLEVRSKRLSAETNYVFAMDLNGCLVSFGSYVNVIPRQFEILTD